MYGFKSKCFPNHSCFWRETLALSSYLGSVPFPIPIGFPCNKFTTFIEIALTHESYVISTAQIVLTFSLKQHFLACMIVGRANNVNQIFNDCEASSNTFLRIVRITVQNQ